MLLWGPPLLLLGGWGRRQVLRRIAGGDPPAAVSPETTAFGPLMELIFTHLGRGKISPPRSQDAKVRQGSA